MTPAHPLLREGIMKIGRDEAADLARCTTLAKAYRGLIRAAARNPETPPEVRAHLMLQYAYYAPRATALRQSLFRKYAPEARPGYVWVDIANNCLRWR